MLSDWYLRADTSDGDMGCASTSIKVYDDTTEDVDACEVECEALTARWMEFSENGACACFSYCERTKPSSDYTSPTKVYHYAGANGINTVSFQKLRLPSEYPGINDFIFPILS